MFDGLIDDLLVYDRALSDGEIGQLYANGSRVNTEELNEKFPANNLVIGMVSYGDQPYVPVGDVWVRIYPNHYQGSDQMGLNCRLFETPSMWEAMFGREHCFVGNQDILNAFADPDERYHVTIYSDDNGDVQWNDGERVYCTPGESMSMSDLSYFNCEL
ncbi:MAG: hypothetical protein JMN27_18365 [gamma proteobacterium endosymbiont of Lamellibrachia anaximandri]|nr:hypothetical protein [gamma proteobacterium endosymbiont of Lamellibrachia anaximandri]MBL3535770.1 hypothetical protein [gamma proteobacterium endosymbiont of Lamellibrachia anaximandri]